MASGTHDSDWRHFQDQVAEILNLIPGCVARVNQPVHGTRIGTVRVDVLAELRSNGFVFRVIVECKFWRRPIPQEKVFSLNTVVEDIGADRGYLISEIGVQSGAAEYLSHPSNVRALTFEEFKSIVANDRFIENCGRCGVKILVSRRPRAGKTAHCRACYRLLRATPRRLEYAAEHERAMSLASTVGFQLVGGTLGSDVKSSLETAVAGGAGFPNATQPLAIFRESLAAAIRSIESQPRGKLFRDFLSKGPYERQGKVPTKLRHQRLSDQETADTIAFIFSHMVNCFKGALTEMLATAPCLHILRELQAQKRLPREARLYVGDAVWAAPREGEGFAKAADLHILVERRSPKATPSVVLAGVAEVKSYFLPPERLGRQLDRHLARARRGLRVGKVAYGPDQITVGCKGGRPAVRITVLPADWNLPRTFHFERKDGRKLLHVDPGVPPSDADSVERVGPLQWRVTLRWSKEALDAAAYEMTFWFMEKLGEVLYSSGVPKEWEGMSPAQAGQNAAKMMLYYAILRCRTVRNNQRAIALYNSYGFGYALGMSFRNPQGRREMLWPQDLDEILATGQNKDGCRIV